MDVTNDNFRSAYQLLERILPGASFVSVDFEFTGLGFSRPSNLDSPQGRYSTARRDSREYPPIQFGVSVFHFLPGCTTTTASTASAANGQSPQRPYPPKQQHEQKHNGHDSSTNVQSELKSSTSSQPSSNHSQDNNKSYWHSTTFNFNLHPRAVYFPFNQQYSLIDKEFRIQASTVHFLSRHGFDFAKNFVSGISWLRKPEEDYLRRTVYDLYNTKRNPKNAISLDSLTDNDRNLLLRFERTLDDWIRDNDHPEAQTSKPPPKLLLLDCPRNPFQRRLVFDLLRRRYPRIAAIVVSIPDRAPKLRIHLHASVQLAELWREREMEMEIEQVVTKEVAARLIFDLIMREKVELVVHNGLLDLTKWYANFVDDLPSSLSDFKQRLKQVFGNVYDTKWIADQFFKAYRQEVADFLPENFDRNVDAFLKFGDVQSYIEVLKQLAFVKQITHLTDFKTFIPLKPTQEHQQEVPAMNIHTIHEVPLERRFPHHTVLSELDQQFDDDADVCGFSRYAFDEHGEYKHEAGFDAFETGVLFACLMQFSECRSSIPSHLSNKIYLGSCGGFKYIDLNVIEEDGEPNEWIQQNVVIVEIPVHWKHDELSPQQQGPAAQHQNVQQRFQLVLCEILKDSAFDAETSRYVVVNRSTFIAVLKHSDPKADDTFSEEKVTKVIINASKSGLHVLRYQREYLTLSSNVSGERGVAQEPQQQQKQPEHNQKGAEVEAEKVKETNDQQSTTKRRRVE